MKSKQQEHIFANEKAKTIFGIEEFNWLNSWERLHLSQKLNLKHICPIENTYAVNCNCCNCSKN